MGTFIKDFKAFAMKGNIVDMAVGVIVGGAFGAIVSSLVNDIIMPVVSLATGGDGLKNLKYVIVNAKEAAGTAAALSVQSHTTTADVHIPTLQQMLEAQGVWLR